MKYYTPKIEEFRVGFEYEFKQLDNWFKDTFNSNECMNDFIGEGFRVKTLDSQDIIDLGWKENMIKSSDELYDCYFKIDLHKDIVEITLSIHDKGCRYFASPPYKTIFHGRLKNKNELRDIMQQLDII